VGKETKVLRGSTAEGPRRTLFALHGKRKNDGRKKGKKKKNGFEQRGAHKNQSGKKRGPILGENGKKRERGNLREEKREELRVTCRKKVE